MLFVLHFATYCFVISLLSDYQLVGIVMLNEQKRPNDRPRIVCHSALHDLYNVSQQTSHRCDETD